MRIDPKFLRRLSPVQRLLVSLIVIAAAYYLFQVSQSGTVQPEPSVTFLVKSPVVDESQTVVSSSTTTMLPKVTKQAASATAEKMSSFDYFVLALSWSPDYCATNGENDPQQCSVGKKLGFVLHGLWPQNNQGYPADCSTEKMPQSVKNEFVGLYPNTSLFDHEWEKHGTCTGLTPVRFLTLSRQFKNSVIIPTAYQNPAAPFSITADRLRKDFSQVNPGFDLAAFEANCSGSGRYLQELYVCFSRSGNAIACGSEVHKQALKSCQAETFIVRNTR